MKITIDETVFNRAIHSGKLELAQWLLDNGCPTTDSVYIQNFNLDVLNWLKQRNITVPSSCLSQVIRKTTQQNIINWFLNNGSIINKETILSCIEAGANSLFKDFTDSTKIKLTIDDYKVALLSENIEILDYLNELECDFNEEMVELAIKHKKKKSIKWLVLNDKL